MQIFHVQGGSWWWKGVGNRQSSSDSRHAHTPHISYYHYCTFRAYISRNSSMHHRSSISNPSKASEHVIDATYQFSPATLPEHTFGAFSHNIWSDQTVRGLRQSCPESKSELMSLPWNLSTHEISSLSNPSHIFMNIHFFNNVWFPMIEVQNVLHVTFLSHIFLNQECTVAFNGDLNYLLYGPFSAVVVCLPLKLK